MEERKIIPIGYENFKEVIDKNLYYVDKTEMIKTLLDSGAKVSLFARPRRFGKTLNMSMLRYFFEKSDEDNSHLFDGLKISTAGEKYLKHMGQYPVISITLKSMKQDNFEDSIREFQKLIAVEFRRHKSLLKRDDVFESDREKFLAVCSEKEKDLADTVKFLSDFMHELYGKKVIILIDEYDVPLQNAWLNGFYQQMINFIRTLFDTSLKTNDSLEFAVLTGCLRISKESIFTGLNNLKVFSVSDNKFSEYFGFTDEEVREMLAYYQLSGYYDIIRKWYDGYRFGSNDMYCPWDVSNYVSELIDDSETYPKAYWINTSGNDIIRKLIYSATTVRTKNEIESLIAGGTIQKKINQELTYRELEDSPENIWSMLYMTGYLTADKIHYSGDDAAVYELRITNLEIRAIFKNQIYNWFDEYVRQDKFRLTEFCMMFKNGRPEDAEKEFTKYLHEVISIRDTSVQISKKENFYHGILLGLFSHMDDWIVRSNVESGDGYSDILIEIPMEKIGIVIEVKYGEERNIEQGCDNALKQIEEKHYTEILEEDDMRTILKYGVACFRKDCMIKIAEK